MKNNMPTDQPMPAHVAIICDGNRRWAKNKNLSTFLGHEYAVNQTLEKLIDAGLEMGIQYLTFWIFSTENWDRDPEEVDWLMNLFRKMFDEKIKKYHEKGVRIIHIGNKAGLASDIQEKIDQGVSKTKDNTKMTVVVAMNYGGRDEIVRANRKMLEQIAAGSFKVEDLTEDSFVQFLDTADIPDPDLIIRTSGEQRLSGFLLWQQQYSEFYFSEVPFPDFTGDELKKAIEDFWKRNRRFGGN
jgi:undecaprenyl diphosphate synthase